ncbi:MAG: hypothetical protein V4676_09575, partial [Bacteroidota bacterium]
VQQSFYAPVSVYFVCVATVLCTVFKIVISTAKAFFLCRSCDFHSVPLYFLSDHPAFLPVLLFVVQLASLGRSACFFCAVHCEYWLLPASCYETILRAGLGENNF